METEEDDLLDSVPCISMHCKTGGADGVNHTFFLACESGNA